MMEVNDKIAIKLNKICSQKVHLKKKIYLKAGN